MEDDGIVAELKYETTAENEGIDVPARKFRLFLVNKNGHWLWEADAEAVDIDERGHEQGFNHMMPSLRLKNDQYSGEGFQPSEGQIHVLVVVPSDIRADVGESDSALKQNRARDRRFLSG
ncbi:hypothetical protein PI124_g20979 [Phytophthora idaei]|nr:hypothetical protein PI124_g20979 [Phytophthora idaei]